MTPGQVAYPLLALVEAVIIFRTRESRAQNAPALRLWLQIQLAIFCILEPTSFLRAHAYGRYFFVCTLVSAAADLMVLYSVFFCLEDGFPAFGTLRSWSVTAILSGMMFCFAAELRLPPKAHGIEIAWLTFGQAFTYIRMLGLIALSAYGWLRASSWPRDLAWTWLAMAVFSITDAAVTRIQILSSNTRIFVLVSSAAALLQLIGYGKALSHVRKPLTALDLESINSLTISNL